MSMIDDVKKIIDNPANWAKQTYSVGDTDATIKCEDYFIKTKIVAHQICRLFPKSADNPDGFEPKCEHRLWSETTGLCLDCGAKISEPKPISNTQSGEGLISNANTTGAISNAPKPDDQVHIPANEGGTLGAATGANPEKSRLLSDEELRDAETRNRYSTLTARRGIARAQLAKDMEWEARTVAVKDAEHQKRIEEIFKEMEAHFIEVGEPRFPKYLGLSKSTLEDIKDKYLKKVKE